MSLTYYEQLEQIQETLKKLTDVLTVQKEESKKLLDKFEEDNKKKLEYKTNLDNYVKYSKLNNEVELSIFENKEKKKILKEKMEHSKSIIDEYHKKKFNNLVITNLEDYLKL